MDTHSKLEILSEDSKYDLACACGTGKEDRRHRGDEGKWLYPVSLPGGGYSIMLKTLLSNACRNDCKYCPLRAGSNVRRCTLTAVEIAESFMDYYRRGKVFGLFLSSGVIDTPDNTMEILNSAIRVLRKKYDFRGYVHLKIIPGASNAAIEDAISLASAVSLNIETPGERHFSLLSDSKNYNEDIIRPIKLISELTAKGSRYHKVKTTTQFIVGASDEKDSEIVKYMGGLYSRLDYDRIYFSAYQPGLGAPDIPGEQNFSLSGDTGGFMREHRLYQAEFLLRKYKFSESEFIFGADGNFSLEKDPKEIWADAHPEFFPVNINKAAKEELIRVPGIGHETATLILKERLSHRISGAWALPVRGKRLDKILHYVYF